MVFRFDFVVNAPTRNFHSARCACCLSVVGVHTCGSDECWLGMTGPFFLLATQLLLPPNIVSVYSDEMSTLCQHVFVCACELTVVVCLPAGFESGCFVVCASCN